MKPDGGQGVRRLFLPLMAALAVSFARAQEKPPAATAPPEPSAAKSYTAPKAPAVEQESVPLFLIDMKKTKSKTPMAEPMTPAEIHKRLWPVPRVLKKSWARKAAEPLV